MSGFRDHIKANVDPSAVVKMLLTETKTQNFASAHTRDKRRYIADVAM